jgi:UDP-N-acetylmuramyl pentapeptide phosphotransferase/UDP-N-acetylglucosamine-1-phosphate transferase
LGGTLTERKLQKDAVSLGGGLAVFLATLLATLSTLWWVPANARGMEGIVFDPRLILLVAAVGIVVLGLLDDVITLRGRQKLLGQIVIVMFLVGAGTVVKSIDILGFSLTWDCWPYP